MVHNKLNLQIIEGTKSRNLSFHNRKNTLKKKVNELSTLCGVKVAMIIYGPQHNEPKIWLENQGEVLELINKFKNQSAQDIKKGTDLSHFLEDRKIKVEIELEKVQIINEAKYPTWDSRFDDLTEEQLRKLNRVLEGKLEVAKARLEVMKSNNSNNKNYSGLQQSSLKRSRSMELEGLKVNNCQQQQRSLLEYIPAPIYLRAPPPPIDELEYYKHKNGVFQRQYRK